MGSIVGNSHLGNKVINLINIELYFALAIT
jgi:hypothetical protein